MSYTEWKDKTADFRKIDVRGIQGNFFQGLKKQADTETYTPENPGKLPV